MTPTTGTGGNPRPAGGAASLAPAMRSALVGGLRILGIAAGSSLLAGSLVVGIAALTGGGEAAKIALIGTAIAVGVFAFGAFAVHLAAAILPSSALLVALMTYACQLVLVFAIFIALSRAGGPADGPQRGWLAAAVIACTLAWIVVQLVATTRQRTLLYDLPEQPGEGSAAAPAQQRDPEGER
jgi:ATP synthase protein I